MTESSLAKMEAVSYNSTLAAMITQVICHGHTWNNDMLERDHFEKIYHAPQNGGFDPDDREEYFATLQTLFLRQYKFHLNEAHNRERLCGIMSRLPNVRCIIHVRTTAKEAIEPPLDIWNDIRDATKAAICSYDDSPALSISPWAPLLDVLHATKTLPHAANKLILHGSVPDLTQHSPGDLKPFYSFI
jgi:hypothetical protein